MERAEKIEMLDGLLKIERGFLISYKKRIYEIENEEEDINWTWTLLEDMEKNLNKRHDILKDAKSLLWKDFEKGFLDKYDVEFYSFKFGELIDDYLRLLKRVNQEMMELQRWEDYLSWYHR